MATTTTTPDPLAEAYTDDWFDIDKYRQAAGVAYEFSKKKLQDTASEERTGVEQRQKFSEADEARDSAQARGAYKY
jgi:hypothetical protein